MNTADTPSWREESAGLQAPHLLLMRETLPADNAEDGATAGLLLLWLGDDALKLVNERLAEHGLSENKLQVLMLFLLQEKGCFGDDTPTPSSIANYCGITRASATGLLDWLEKRGLIARTPHPTDRRSLQLKLTDQARTVLGDALPGFWRSCSALTDALDAQEKSQLLTLLAKMWNATQAR
ncbi:MarR family winged helix-turn-helix transcriptional regulator [Chromobacterium sphagni]|uniref:MarR family transcriptional regulator n=1 Tax=Chromobacterium sphagni TaxID=1903179 RepID=A0A1S1WW88_9NEIS|nr:MarR family transcriptional regulator [Chromobacterium sphagni]OHX11305.1 MarR family transcriptional regulator [Chromobacterium sphagni]OHX19017.1 MarR family transcriptional regulator [Chromobacterium sphagni]